MAILKCKCIKRFRDKNNIIIGYRLQAPNGDTKDFKSEQLKNFIRAGKLEVDKLTLTSDNRLVPSARSKSTNTGLLNSKHEDNQLSSAISSEIILKIIKPKDYDNSDFSITDETGRVTVKITYDNKQSENKAELQFNSNIDYSKLSLNIYI